MTPQALALRDVLKIIRNETPAPQPGECEKAVWSRAAEDYRGEFCHACGFDTPSCICRRSEVLWPDDMDFIADMRDIDLVKASMRERIKRLKTTYEQQKVSSYCEEVSQAFAVMALLALKEDL